MKIKIALSLLFLATTLFSFSQRTAIAINNTDVTVASYINKEVSISGKSNVHITAATKTLNNSVINLSSESAWVYFDNVRPTIVIDSLLKFFTVNGVAAINKTNIRVAIYKHGTVVIAHPATIQPLKVYTDQNFKGDSASYGLYTFYKALGTTIDNKIRSFKLKRGYMATLANTADGTGYSRVFIADDKDLEFSILPNTLDKTVSFIRVVNWEWVSKKGWCGYAPNDLNLTKSTWRYDWSAGGATTSTVEYVPIRQNAGWPGWDEISGKQGVSHVLGYNEPDHVEQSNVTVATAIQQWPEMLKTGLRIGSPACTNFTWLYQFMDSCKAHNYRVDYVAVHAYWGGKSPQNWYNDLKYIHTRTGRPIWITEWNNGANWTTETWPTADKSLSAANAAKQLADIKAILNVLDTASFIERYSVYNWVQDCRAMTLGDTLTPAGKYYAANKSVMAYNNKKEVIPTFTFNNPSMTVAYATKKLTLTMVDPNSDFYRGFILEKKVDNGVYTEFFRSENSSLKQFSDTLDFNAATKVRYRARSIMVDGTISAYTNEIGHDVTKGDDVQTGNLSFANVGWNTVFFNKAFSSTNLPSIILGATTNYNSSVLLAARAKLISATSRFTVQLAPWAYQNITTLSKEESVPYFIIGAGTYDFGGLKAKAGKAVAGTAWTPIAFTAPFDTIPVVFVTQLNPTTVNATTVRVRNVTKTGFEARLQKETKVKLTPTSESISYFAITTGTGMVDGKKIIVGKTAPSAISSTAYTTINYGDSIANPIFLTQMQTCNDDTVTATIRCLTITPKFANVMKQRERSTGVTSSLPETGGWMLINPVGIIQGVHTPVAEQISLYPNPVKDVIYFNHTTTENLQVEIFNLIGVMVKSELLNENKMVVTDLAPGCYILKTKNKGSKTFIKL